MGNISRDTFKLTNIMYQELTGEGVNQPKHYSGVRLQQGVPLIDADWNELEDIEKYERRAFIKWIVGNGVPKGSDGFHITNATVTDFTIKEGVCYVDGWDAINPGDIQYTKQDLYNKNDLAGKWGVDPLLPLQMAVGKRYLVYLDVWEREVNAQEDSRIVNNAIGIETCTRLKREWVVRVEEGVAEGATNTTKTPPVGHAYYPLAILSGGAGGSSIIADLRLTDICLSEVTSSTGVLVFPAFTHSQQNTSEFIDPRLGKGPIIVHLGVELANGQTITGESGIGEVFNLSMPLLGVLTDPQLGMFKVGIKVDALNTPSIRVRWWAFKPRQDLGEKVLQAGVYVSITPSTVALSQGGTRQFSATVQGTSNQGVTWSIDESGGGSITTSGLYTAPSKEGTFHVRATSKADTGQYAQATVTVNAVSVTISPSTATLNQGGTRKFTATVAGTTNTGVTWTTTGGTVDNSGNYTAPNTAGTYKVRATSAADSSKYAEATITVNAVSVTISPTVATIDQGGTKQFTATVTGTTNKTVTWSAPTGGTVGSSGNYTAPNAAGIYKVRATSAADSSKYAEATVNVNAVSVTISPTTVTLNPGGAQKFTATVTGTTNKTVTWTATRGTIDSSGNYKAPSSVGSCQVKAASAADSSKSATAAVTVTSCTGSGPNCTSGNLPDRPCTGTGPDCSGRGLPGRPDCTGTYPQ
jgi:hypothetical protein